MAWNSDPVVLTVAVTGADVFRENNPNIPTRPRRSPTRAIDAAAPAPPSSTCTCARRRHAQRPPRALPGRDRRIRSGSDLLTMVSTGGANDMTIEERTTGLEAKPDISGVESGSMNFGDETFITPPPAGRGIIERATKAGIALEVEAFDLGHVVSAVRWLEEGMLPPPLRINLVFGVPAASTPRPRRWRRCSARCPPTPSGPSPASAATTRACWRWRCFTARPGSAPAWRTPSTSPGRARARQRGAVPEGRGADDTLGREVATQEQTPELLRLG